MRILQINTSGELYPATLLGVAETSECIESMEGSLKVITLTRC
jgi:hypothetical protein